MHSLSKLVSSSSSYFSFRLAAAAQASSFLRSSSSLSSHYSLFCLSSPSPSPQLQLPLNLNSPSPPNAKISHSNSPQPPPPPAMVGYTPPAVPQKPEWLEALLSEKFFTPCSSHSSVKKNERNIYCVDCSVGICQHCLPNHSPHRLLQIRRYVYHDVIRMQDIQKLVDCAHVQPYIINSAKVVFLNQRPQPRPSKGLGNVCETCERTLQDAYKYCSVACKIEAVVKQGKHFQPLLPLCNSLQISDLLASSSSSLALPSESMTAVTMKAMATATTAEGEDEEEQEQLSPNSVLGGPTSCSPTSSGSTANDGLTWGGTIAMATTAITKKLRTTHSPKPSISMISVTWPSINRRKSTPHRSPIF